MKAADGEREDAAATRARAMRYWNCFIVELVSIVYVRPFTYVVHLLGWELENL